MISHFGFEEVIIKFIEVFVIMLLVHVFMSLWVAYDVIIHQVAISMIVLLIYFDGLIVMYHLQSAMTYDGESFWCLSEKLQIRDLQFGTNRISYS